MSTNERYSAFITPRQKLDWLTEELVTIAGLLEDISVEILRNEVRSGL